MSPERQNKMCQCKLLTLVKENENKLFTFYLFIFSTVNPKRKEATWTFAERLKFSLLKWDKTHRRNTQSNHRVSTFLEGFIIQQLHESHLCLQTTHVDHFILLLYQNIGKMPPTVSFLLLVICFSSFYWLKWKQFT